ncbi:phosphatidate cytidylyltransferase, mitochondrial-like [Littorina saxatilis]|uniref:Phosphatidate cytidylyltransferase, mitochondrial n=1 Tax=Littorina saxatilis TaxID=31220 RepID=A0AAN9BCB3_9CAEN
MISAARCLLFPCRIAWREVLSKQNCVLSQALQKQQLLHFSSATYSHQHSLHRRKPKSLADPSLSCEHQKRSWHQSNQGHYVQRRFSSFHSSSPGLDPEADLAEVSSMSQLYYRILESVPEGIQMAFAYGSGVYKQAGHNSTKENMLDLIFVVDDPHAWHNQNIQRNRGHYSFLRVFGSRAVSHVQDLGAGVYFNTLVPFEDRVIKYGVISTDRLITDLLDWETLYISGRLHKPIRLLVLPSNHDLIQAMQVNLQSAVHAALLLLPEEFCEEALYTTIAGLSYNGDFRMVVGEDRNKVANIVSPNIPHFRRLYQPIVDSAVHVHWHHAQGRLEQDPNHITQFHHLQLLPKTVLMLLQENRTRPGSHPDLEEVLMIYANSSHCDDTVARVIAHIVWRSSVSQSAKTSLTAGARKSVVYTFKKLKKMWKGKPKREMMA